MTTSWERVKAAESLWARVDVMVDENMMHVERPVDWERMPCVML